MLSLVVACGAPPATPTPAPAPAPAQAVPADSKAPPAAAAPAAPNPGPMPAAERAAIAGRVAFVAEPGGKQQVDWVPPSGEGRATLLSGTGPIYPAAFTPDGGLLAAIAVEEEGEVHRERLQVYALRPGEPPALQWTSAPTSHVRNPDWSSDGRWLVFEADYDSFRELYRVDLARPEPRRLTHNEEGNFEPDISPDGLRIAFASSRDGNAEVYTMTAEGGDPRRLTTFHRNDSTPRWSPDGRALAFLSDRDNVERIYLIDPDGANLRRLTAVQSEGAPAETWPLGHEPHEQDHAWSPDGRALAFATRTGPEGASLRVADPARPGAVTVLTSGELSDRSPVYSPDGRHLVFVSNRSPGGDLDLYLIRVDGTALARLTDTPGADWLPRWVATAK